MQFLELRDDRPLRARRQIVLEIFDTVRWPFDMRLDTAIGTVAHVTNHLMTSGCSKGKESIAYTLYFASDHKFSSDFIHIA